jgi:hypothetical protein
MRTEAQAYRFEKLDAFLQFRTDIGGVEKVFTNLEKSLVFAG